MSYRLVSAILNASPVEGLDRFVLVVLAEMADKRTGEVTASYERIAERTRLARSRVALAIRNLDVQGAVTVTRCHRRVNRYRVLRPQDGTKASEFASSGETQTAPLESSGRTPSGKDPVSIQLGTRRPPAADGRSRSSHRTPDPRIGPLLHAFTTAHRAALGQPYPGAGGRDGAALRRALQEWEPATITATLPAYFEDPWICDHGPTVAKWVELLPSLLRRQSGASRGFVG